MPKHYKVTACLVVLLAALLYIFFQVSKHQPALAQVNAFADDPYDSVASFGVQFSIFTALLTLIRAFRPYQPDHVPDEQKVLYVRSALITCISVVVVMLADVIALLRYPAAWLGSAAGYTLAALVILLALCALLLGWLIHHTSRALRSARTRTTWLSVGGISLAVILVLALYQADWRQTVWGEFLTVLVGTTCFFATVRAWELCLAPALNTSFEDSIDDIASIYRSCKARMGYLSGLFMVLEKVQKWPLVNWLNPRKHAWNGIILFGILMGVLLTLAETFGEGGPGPHQIGRLAIIASVFISLESAGVLLGYILLAQPLGLFRRTRKQQIDASLSR